mgnify:CR=1 FL=1
MGANACLTEQPKLAQSRSRERVGDESVSWDERHLIELIERDVIDSDLGVRFDDIAALDPRLKILQSRTEYRSGASAEMQTSSEQLFDMRDDGAVYSGAAAFRDTHG